MSRKHHIASPAEERGSLQAKLFSWLKQEALRPLRLIPLSIILCLLLSPVFILPANAEIPGSVTAEEKKGYGRMVFDFEKLPPYSHSMVGSILILNFEKSVTVTLDRVVDKLPSYIAVARRDPDGKAIRFAFIKDFRVNLMEVGNKLFVDILPKNWVGLTPSLPQEVVREIAQRVAETEKRAREEARQRALMESGHELKLRLGTYLTFSRIVFDWNKFTVANLARSGSILSLKFGHNVPVDLSRIKLEPPEQLQNITVKKVDDGMLFELTVAPNISVRGFREGYTYIVDLSNPDSDLQTKTDQISELIRKSNEVPPPKKTEKEEINLSGVEAGDKRRMTKPKSQERSSPSTSIKTSPFDPNALESQSFADWEKGITLGAPNEQENLPADRSPEKAMDSSALETPSPAPPNNNGSSPGIEPGIENVKIPAQPGKKMTAEKIADPGNGMPPSPKSSKTSDKQQGLQISVDKNDRGLHLTFPFKEAVAASVFRRSQTIWIVFDSNTPIAHNSLKEQVGDLVSEVSYLGEKGMQLLRIKLKKPWLTFAKREGNKWIISLGNARASPSKPLSLNRGLRSDGRSIITITLQSPGRVHWIDDPELGDRLAVVTAFNPIQNIIKSQYFVDFQALPTVHGVAIKPSADDLSVKLRYDDLLIARKRGLILSATDGQQDRGRDKPPAGDSQARAGFIDFKAWQLGGKRYFVKRIGELERAISKAKKKKDRTSLRLKLARLYMSHELGAEVLAITKRIVNTQPGANSAPALVILRAAASALMGRTKKAADDLNIHALVEDDDAALWRSLVNAREKKWHEALRDFKRGESLLDSYPFEIQAKFRLSAIASALKVQVLSEAEKQINKLYSAKLSHKIKAQLNLITGSYFDQIGNIKAAKASYDRAIKSRIDLIVADARFHKLKFAVRSKKIDDDKAIQELERLSVLWRGDETELKTLRLLSELYVKKGKYQQAFKIMKNALLAFPKEDIALQIHDDMKKVFLDIFLYKKKKDLSPVVALSLYYDYREMTPPGHLGDEIIRRLADRLVDIDLLAQAAEFLDYQVTRRLKGAARSQVATRLAMIQLMDRKPALALKAIRQTRSTILPHGLTKSRDLLEARALSELGRLEGAIDILNRHQGEDVDQFRADAYWNGRAWQKAGEQIERNLADRWRKDGDLNEKERFNVLRAAVSYSLSDDQFGLDRLQKKFYPKMLKTPDAEAFATVTKAIKTKGKNFRNVIKDIASVDTLLAFMKEFRKNYDRFDREASELKKKKARKG